MTRLRICWKEKVARLGHGGCLWGGETEQNKFRKFNGVASLLDSGEKSCEYNYGVRKAFGKCLKQMR